jgi:tetratricopeptide (TPR) repeat protein
MTTQIAFALVTEDDINRAYHASDVAALEGIRKQLNAEDPNDAYLAAYIDWRLAGIHFSLADTDTGDGVLQRGQEILEALVEQAPESAEAWALLSTTYGMRIGINPMVRGMTMGYKADRAIEQAMKLEPENPRVLIIYAIGKLNTPPMFGGSDDKAMEALDRAIAVLAVSGPGRYAWGEADAYIWRGIARKRQGQLEQAAADFDAALDAVPSHDWAEALRADVNTD